MLKDAVDQSSVAVGAEAGDWREAVLLSSRLLEAAGAVGEGYGQAMIRTVEELGPYVAVAPGVAIPHARPEDGAMKVAVSVAVLADPVEFGSEENDPVNLLFGFATPNSDSHVDTIRDVVDFIKDQDRMAELRAAESNEEALEVLRR